MALIRWEPARELNSLQSEMNRLLTTYFDASPSDNAGPVRRWVPAMDLVETQDAFILRADLPGLDEGDISIQLENDVLTVSGERKADHEQEGEGYYRVERMVGSFARSLTLPDGVDPEAVAANFDKGVLEVRIQKPEQVKPRKVEIAVGGGGRPTIEGKETGRES
jgi:HSP20 family protein